MVAEVLPSAVIRGGGGSRLLLCDIRGCHRHRHQPSRTAPKRMRAMAEDPTPEEMGFIQKQSRTSLGTLLN